MSSIINSMALRLLSNGAGSLFNLAIEIAVQCLKARME